MPRIHRVHNNTLMSNAMGVANDDYDRSVSVLGNAVTDADGWDALWASDSLSLSVCSFVIISCRVLTHTATIA